MKRMTAKEDSLAMRKRKERTQQLKAILLKYRQLSLQQQILAQKGKAVTQSDLEERKTMALSGLRHKDGNSFNETEKLQVKWMLKELRQKLGIDIHWQKDKNGIVRGYGIVDHKTKTAFDGSQVLKMGEWMDIQTKRNEEMGQKAKGTSKREQTETCFQYAERKYLRRSQRLKGSKVHRLIGSKQSDSYKHGCHHHCQAQEWQVLPPGYLKQLWPYGDFLPIQRRDTLLLVGSKCPGARTAQTAVRPQIPVPSHRRKPRPEQGMGSWKWL